MGETSIVEQVDSPRSLPQTRPQDFLSLRPINGYPKLRR